MKHLKTLAALALGAALLLTGCGTKAPAVEDPILNLGVSAFGMKDYEATMLFFKEQVDGQLNMMGMTPEALLAEEGGSETYNAMISGGAMQQLMLEATLENLMAEEKLELDQEKVQAKVDENRDLMGGDEEMDALLGEIHMDRDQFARLLISPEIMLQQLQNHYRENRPNEIRSYFNDNYLRAKHILLNEEEGGTERQAEAQALAEEARNGADFDALIAEHGQDPGMIGNPDGYVFPEGQMVQEFYEGTLALEENAISDPIRTSYGWHIIQRLPLDDSSFTNNFQSILEGYMSTVIDGWISSHEPEVDDRVKTLTVQDLLPAAEEETPAEEEAPAEEETPTEEPQE